MKKYFWGLCVFLCVFSADVFADYNPPDGGEELYDLLSPLSLARGPSLVSLESPFADAVNPAASALLQRVTLGGNYIGLADFDGDGWEGHVLNAGASFPTSYGVITGSAQYLHSTLDQMFLGQAGTLRMSFAKDLFPELLIGAGLHGSAGDAGRAGEMDFGVAADLGFIHLIDSFPALEKFRWGASLRNLGKGYKPVSGRSAFPSPFTPAVGAGFTAFRNENLELELTSDLVFPYCQDFRVDFGAGLILQDWITLNASSRFDLRQHTEDGLSRRSLIPAFGLTAVFRIDLDIKAARALIRENEWQRSDINLSAAGAPLHRGIWALGLGATVNLGLVDTNPPVIQIDYPEELFISPNLDGSSDALLVPLSITDERFIKEYRLTITDAAGNPVRVIENKEKRPENESLRSVIDKLFAEKKGIDIPDSLRWDGIGDSGSRVPDGEYAFSLAASDDNGNSSLTGKQRFVIDTTPPAAEIKPILDADLIFSPNDDGSKDVLVIAQSGSAEDLWEARILDAAGKPVRGFTWKAAPPGEVVWDGKDDAGILLPDGVYSYTIASKDKAGNAGDAGFGNIIINTEATPISLAIDRAYFSPNADGALDTVTLTPVIPVTNGLDSWELFVANAAGQTVRRYTGRINAPLPLAFDGKGEDGAVLPEAAYTAKLTVLYRNGNRPQADSPVFTLDLKKPEANVWSDLTVFSPNGDANKDEIEIYQESSSEEKWTGTLRSASGRIVRAYTWQEKADAGFIWNGAGEDGRLVPDGAYTYQLECTDRAGNTGLSNVLSFSINTEETPVILSADLEAFSPNRDGVKDAIRFTPTYKVEAGIESSVIVIRGAAGAEILRNEARGRLDNLSWDGKAADGKPAPDGNYSAEITVYYQNGNRSVSRTGLFELDTRPPEITASADTQVFCPAEGSLKPAVNFTQVSSSEPLWEGRIVNTQNADVKTFFWKGRAENFAWDGTDSHGNKVPDGAYGYIIAAEDKAGNRSRTALSGIRVDTRPLTAFITAAETAFSPNGDGFKDTLDLTAYLGLTDGLESWRLDVKDSRGRLRKTFSGGADFVSPAKLVWDGKGGDGAVLEDTYTAEFSALYARGSQPKAVSTPFLVDISAPEATAGLAPIPFSPDNDGISDELAIGLFVKDASPIQDWSFVISDRMGKTFTAFSGKGMPAAEILWDGRSSTGELVLAAEDYPFVFTVSDTLGNTRRVPGKIPIDILVIRDGDRLKIRISNINFAPNSPEVVLDSSETGQKNLSILTRLVEVLAKYGGYQVLVEGHGNNISGTPREETEELAPLSIARAQEVRKALVALGLAARRISAEGRGGTQMIFPFSDRDNNWKNRRVEFILLK